MAETHVVSALIEKRARVSGELQAELVRVMRLRSDLANLDACIRMFKADYDPDQVEPKVTLGKNPAGLPKGTGSRKALDILREAGEALSAQELAQRILCRMGRDPTPEAVDMLAKTIHSSFTRQRRPVVEYDRSTWPGKWKLLANDAG